MLDSAIGFLGNAYPWVKAAHLTFVVFWIAGLFLLPRFYVYHHATAPGSAEDRAWVDRERRTRSIILGPALVIVWVLGLALAVHIGAWNQGWFHAKLLLVVLLSGFQGWLGAYGRKLARGDRPLENKTLRIMNEIPGIMTAVIVVLVIVKPF
ncbi:putative membrane protein [Sphingomonas kaistensis]|uniref:Protoporphyrinogen IX oxidase n=1 Tax=Sphingomonas kaistensis TaxID=298708 RepID=A0A7X6BFI7_9SPHN|nr:CopD family protein [Sphingomonas kaistensis]NJC04853.1 putative membrane protein [Sphingomonas kaistensis]